MRKFWDAHFPFMLALHSDYDYLAVQAGAAGDVIRRVWREASALLSLPDLETNPAYVWAFIPI